MDDLQNDTKAGLSESEEKLLEVMINPENRMKSITDVCNIAQISRPTYYRAFEKKEFNEAYTAKSKELIKQSVAPIVNTFIREAQRGSYQHGKIVLEMAGMYTEKQSIESTNLNTNLNISEEDSSKLLAHATQEELEKLAAGEMSLKQQQEIINR